MSDFDANAFLNNDSAPTAAPKIAPAAQPASAFNADSFLGNEQGISNPGVDQSLANYDQLQAQYGGAGQQAVAGLEAGAQGVIGSLAPYLEVKSGITTPEAIHGREEANPDIHALSKMGGFAGSLLTGVGEGKIIGAIGEGAVNAARLGEAAAPIAKLAASGVRTGAEMAALQSDDEITKMITKADPNQSLGSAAINIGLAGLLGAGGGAALGAVSPLWATAKNKIGAEKIANDFMAETEFLRNNPDLAQGSAQEVTTRLGEADQILNGGLKGKAIAETLPEATPENLGKIDAFLYNISNKAFKRIEDASENAYLKGSVSKLNQDLTDFNSVITDPKASIADKWDALDQFKRVSQGHANYNVITGGAEDKALSKWIKPFNAELREAAENSDVWGQAGKVQKTVNKATSALYDAQKDFLPKATDKELGERVASPTKLQTLINTSEKGKVGVRQNAVKNYLKATQDAADAINAAHVNNGLEAPLESKLNSTPILDRVLNAPVTPGRSLAQWANRKGAQAFSRSIGESAAGVAGGGFGAIIGHPLLGAWAGEKILTPVFSALAKPFAENAINSNAMKASIDFAANSARGATLLNRAAKAIFKSGELIPQHLLPDEKSRKRIKSQLSSMNENPENALNVGGNVGHYLPQHAVGAGMIAANAMNYFNSLKPKQTIQNPLDAKPVINKDAEVKYNRALDIAQQPLLVLQHAKKGTLQAQDIQTLNTLYPELRKEMVSKVTEGMMNHINEKGEIPYHQRQSLSMLLGSPLDSTFALPIAQSVFKANSTQQTQAQTGPAKQHKASGKELTQINKVNELYNTPLEQRLSNKKA